MDSKRLAFLVTQAQKGDLKAFEELYSAHAQSILFHVKSLLYNKEDYADIAQDVAVRLYEQIGTLKEPLAFRGWMHQVIRNKCTDQNRSYLRQQKYQGPEDGEEYLETIVDESVEADPAAAWDTKLEGNKVYAAISGLSSNYREVLILRYYDDLSYKEIAEALGVSVDNVKVRLHRATEAARKIMSEQENKEREGVFVEGDSQTKAALTAAVAVIVPPEVVSQYITDANLKLATVAPPVAAGGAAAASSPVLGKLAIVITSIAAVAALVGGCAGLTWYYGQNEAIVGDTTTVTEQVHDYEGTATILFVDAQGEDTQHGVSQIALIEKGAVLTSCSYQVTDAQGAVVLEGDDILVDVEGLNALEPGTYKVIFDVTDQQGASAQLSRSFIVQ